MIAAHMDEIGFMITNITTNGMLQFTNLGGAAMIYGRVNAFKLKQKGRYNCRDCF